MYITENISAGVNMLSEANRDDKPKNKQQNKSTVPAPPPPPPPPRPARRSHHKIDYLRLNDGLEEPEENSPKSK